MLEDVLWIFENSNHAVQAALIMRSLLNTYNHGITDI